MLEMAFPGIMSFDWGGGGVYNFMKFSFVILFIIASVTSPPPQVEPSISRVTTTPCFPSDLHSWGICFDVWVDLVVQLWIFLWDCFSVSTPFAKALVW